MEACGVRLAGSGQNLDWRKDVVKANSLAIAVSDDADTAMSRLLDLSHARLEYPEVSFARIGKLVTEAMGVRLEYSSPLPSAATGDWVEMTVRTLSGLGSGTEWEEMRNMPIRACEVTILHDGLGKTTFTNQRGPALI